MIVRTTTCDGCGKVEGKNDAFSTINHHGSSGFRGSKYSSEEYHFCSNEVCYLLVLTVMAGPPRELSDHAKKEAARAADKPTTPMPVFPCSPAPARPDPYVRHTPEPTVATVLPVRAPGTIIGVKGAL